MHFLNCCHVIDLCVCVCFHKKDVVFLKENSIPSLSLQRWLYTHQHALILSSPAVQPLIIAQGDMCRLKGAMLMLV